MTGKGAADTEPTVQGMIHDNLAKAEREAKIRREVIKTLARSLDSFIDSFSAPNKGDHKKVARDFARTLGQHLNVAVFAESGGNLTAPIRPWSTLRSEDSGAPLQSVTTGTSYAAAANRGGLVAQSDLQGKQGDQDPSPADTTPSEETSSSEDVDMKSGGIEAAKALSAPTPAGTTVMPPAGPKFIRHKANTEDRIRKPERKQLETRTPSQAARALIQRQQDLRNYEHLDESS
ncbi:hypothetical protein BKA67DRAFT_644388 [Truncatella angustata]|uniref:Uncharacterized protein n=1 Tax=Truncatella angustata TaxID=152316 RepID=A0A9P8UV66_9PEZI|nr:uncharacterized protein BKA67DRAFT_644388 [Truncatella angustata]KAH6658605.1 hypothetical protein BKA67DRAFT_644388 [Truncatella angustata]